MNSLDLLDRFEELKRDVSKRIDFEASEFKTILHSEIDRAMGVLLSHYTKPFPEAEGFARSSAGGAGGDVYTVTSLADSGAGTLREGVDNVPPQGRTINFGVDGTIELADRIRIFDNYVTIDGSTAPGDGIQLKGYGLRIQGCHDIVVRHIRVRPGDIFPEDHDPLFVYRCRNVMLDHLSLQWGIDEGFNSIESDYVTLQWSIVAEGLHNSVHSGSAAHSMGPLIVGNKVSLHHNLFAHNNSRNAQCRMDVDFVNNAIYNWGEDALQNVVTTNEPIARMNAEGNYFRPGPSTTDARIYFSHAGSELWEQNNSNNGTLEAMTSNSTILPSRLEYPQVAVDTPDDALTKVLADAGCSFSRDSVDQRIIDDVINGTGAIIDSQDDVGGWPVLS